MGVKINPYDIVGTQIADAHVEEYIGFYPEKNGKGVKRHYYRYSDVDGETHVTTRDNLMKRKGRNDYSELIGKRYGKIVITKYLGRVINILPISDTTAAMRKAWMKADCGGHEETNIITSHGTIPAIDIIIGLCVRPK